MKKIMWGDFHSNLHHAHILGDFDSWYEQAKEMLDFWAVVYYPFRPYEGSKEDITDYEVVKEDLEIMQQKLKDKFEKDGYIVFPAYEWQGDGSDGDHNVFFKENLTWYNPLTYKELIEKLPQGEAIAIPHHPGYAVGHRGKNWATHNPNYSPVTEIYSSHGCSEDDVSAIPLDVHIHMGPKEGAGTVYQGLNKGHITGIICSGDNHCTSAISGNGFMGVVCEEYTKDAIFKAILNRQTYGVTRSKIKLDYTLNKNMMGSIIKREKGKKYIANLAVEGTGAIDRVEFIKNGIADYTYVHNGKWEREELGSKVKFKFELEFGWGPDLRVYPEINKKVWDIKIEPEDGKILDVEKLWKHPGQKIKTLTEDKLEMEITTTKEKAGNGKLSQKNYLSPYISNQSVIIEMEGKINSNVKFTIDGKIYNYTVKDIIEGSKLVGLLEEMKKIAKEKFGFDEFYRTDPFWHNCYKFKIHKGWIEKSYRLQLDYEVLPEKERDYLLVKIYQKNGDIAWSSPIWIEN